MPVPVSVPVSVYMSVSVWQIPSLEKEFRISSTTSGALVSSLQVGYFSTLLFVSYFGQRAHIPRLLSLFSVAVGLIALIPVACELTSLPSFPASASSSLPAASDSNTSLTGEATNDKFLCKLLSSGNGSPETAERGDGERTKAEESASNSKVEASRMWMVYVLALSSVAFGIAKSAEIPLPLHYIDNNVEDASKTGLLAGEVFLFRAYAVLLLCLLFLSKT